MASRQDSWTAGRLILALVGALAMVAVACGDDPPGSPERPMIVATTSIWADLVTNVACDGQAEVETIIPIGGDPHGFEASLADRATMEDAALVVANGLLLEESLDDTIDSVASAGTPVIRVAEAMDTIEFAGADPSDHEGVDPHVWFDPQRVAAALPALAQRLVDDVGLDAEVVQACLAAYQTELAGVDAEIVAMVAALSEDRRLLVTNHEALGYFADRYGFEVIGTVIPAPSGLAETNPAQLEALAQLIEESGVPAVFAETQHSSADAEALAARVGNVEVVTLFTDSLGDKASGADTYLGLLRTTATLVTAALS